MSFAALQKLITYALAALGLTALSFGGELPVIALLLLAIGFVASWFVEGKTLARPGWSRGWTVALGIALAAQIARGFSGESAWLGLAMEFAGLLSVSRLCNRRTAADYQQIAMLAFIQLIAATVLTSDLGYAGLFVAFVIVTPWALTLAHLRLEIERNYPQEQDARGGTDLARVLASRRIVGWPFLLWTLLLSVPMLAMTVALFVVFPRVGLGFVSFGSNRGQHVSGFGSDIELGAFGLIRDDPTVVLRLSTARPLSVEEQQRYLRLRGTAFDHYDGRKWTRSKGSSVNMSPLAEFYPLRRMPQSSDREFKIILDRLDEPVLFLPPGTVGLRIPRRGIPGSARERLSIARGHGLDLRYQAGDEPGVVYDAIVSTDPADFDVPIAHDMDDESYLQLPPGHERVLRLARDLAGHLSDPRAVAVRFVTHLRDGNRFQYSLDLPDPRGKLPLEVFLFEAKRGHCEYFATALAIMLRAVGIPSRNVTGFVGGEYNRYGGYYGVRQSDAHSWVEALLPGRGWVTLDATPPSRHELGPVQWLFTDVRDAVDALRAYWMMRVVNYDLRTQIRALRELRAFLREISWPSWSGGNAEGSRVGVQQHPTGELAASAVRLGVGLFLVLLALIVVRARRKRRGEPKLSAAAHEARKLYRELEVVLAKKGHARPASLSPEAHARALRAQGFGAADAVDELTEAYVEARYGQIALSTTRVRALKKRIDAVKRAA